MAKEHELNKDWLAGKTSESNKKEEVRPENFFSNQGAYNSLADKIKNIPQHLIKDDPSAGQTYVKIEDPEGNPTNNAFDSSIQNESATILVNPDDEKAALAAKYGIVDPAESINKQNDAFQKLLGDDTPPDQDVIHIHANREEEVVVVNNFGSEESKQRWNNQQLGIVQDDPIIRMFKGVKRNLDFNVSIDISNKIPRTDFIEMMEDSYETSIIDFLSDEFTNKILENPSIIRDMIKAKITELVYGETTKEIPVPQTPPASQTIVEGENPVKKVTRTRKPSVKKESTK